MPEYSQRYKNFINNGNSYTFLPPIYAFVDLLEKYQKKNMTVCEIGTSDGSTTRAYIDIIKKNEGQLFAIDWFEGSLGVPGGHHVHNPQNSENIFNLFLNNLSEYQNFIKILKGRSHEMIQQLPNESLDICFIDASHLYHDVFKDISLILPKMKKGGILCGHDCEDINLANTGRPEWLNMDFVPVEDSSMPKEHPHYGKRWVHYGVIQSVYDHFGYDVYIIADPEGQGVPIWVKYL
jgi:hypothetical protein